MSIKLMTKIFDLNLPSTSKLIFLALADNMNDQGGCFVKITTLMRKTSLCRRSLFKHLAELKVREDYAEDKNNPLRILKIVNKSHKNGGQRENDYFLDLHKIDFLLDNQGEKLITNIEQFLIDLWGERGVEDGTKCTTPMHETHASKENRLLNRKLKQKFGSGSGKGEGTRSAYAESLCVFFDKLEEIYPGQIGSKKKVMEKLAKLKPDDMMKQKMINAIKDQIFSKEKEFEETGWTAHWRHLATWLNQDGWADEVRTKPAQQKPTTYVTNY